MKYIANTSDAPDNISCSLVWPNSKHQSGFIKYLKRIRPYGQNQRIAVRADTFDYLNDYLQIRESSIAEVTGIVNLFDLFFISSVITSSTSSVSM